MKNTTLPAAAIGLLCAATLSAAYAAPKAKITASQAKAAAVKKVPGSAQSATYEFEDGKWQYAVLVNGSRGGLYEVEVDATSGKVTDTEKTTPAEEAQEAAADKKAAMHKSSKGESGETGEAGEAGEAGG